MGSTPDAAPASSLPHDLRDPGGDFGDLGDDPRQPKGGRTGNHVQDFPDRIEKLLESISSVYMDNDNISSLYQQKRQASQNVSRHAMLGPDAAPRNGPPPPRPPSAGSLRA